MRLLYVDDDPIARDYVSKGLSRHGYTVDLAPDECIGFQRAFTTEYDLILMDVILPDAEGFDLLQELRNAGVDTPVLFLSARGDVTDRVRGLDLGADDYLPKPFAFAELVSRIRAIARRRMGEPVDGCFTVADLVVDIRRHAVARSGRRIELTPKQFDLLELLVRNSGVALSRTLILERVWGQGFQAGPKAVDVHINGLRARIDADFQPPLVHTVKGIGYVLEDRGPVPEGTEPDEISP